MGGGRDGGVRAPGAATVNDAQECDDAEGYYKASIGEIVALPKERGSSILLAFRIVDDAMGREDATSVGITVSYRVSRSNIMQQSRRFSALPPLLWSPF